MSNLSQRVSNLSAAQLELLTKRLVERQRPADSPETISRRPDTATAPPLSFAQERLWFLHQREPASAAFNIPIVIRITGPLDLSALEQSLNEIVRRHESLRTTFAVVEGQLVQVIARALTIKLSPVDLRHYGEDERELETRRLIDEEGQRPFSLSEGPLLRIAILIVGEAEHVVLFTMHHIVSDGWSMGVLMREVAAFYESFSTGRLFSLPDLQIQYADYAVWQRRRLQGELLDEHVSYWRRQLGGELPVMELPADKPRASVKSYRGKVQSFVLSTELSASILALSRGEGVTLFMTLLAAFQALLQRYTNQDDIIVGTNIANRNRNNIEKLIGLFVNNLVLRVSLSGEPTFRELLARVRKVTLDAYAHQYLPFEMLLEELQPNRKSGQSPLFQVMFVFQNNPLPELKLRDLVLSPVLFRDETSKFDLTLFMRESEKGLTGSLEYNTELFKDSTIERLSEHYQSLLKAVVENPDEELKNISISHTEQSSRLINSFNKPLE